MKHRFNKDFVVAELPFLERIETLEYNIIVNDIDKEYEKIKPKRKRREGFDKFYKRECDRRSNRWAEKVKHHPKLVMKEKVNVIVKIDWRYGNTEKYTFDSQDEYEIF